MSDAAAETAPASPWLVSTEWLAAHLDAPDLVVVDGSWHLPTAGRNGRAEYLAAHIPGAVFFDIDAIADTTRGLPHMLPKPHDFAAAVGALGIGDGAKIVVYDGAGLFSAPRVWWTLRAFGAQDVSILDGGFPKWLAEGRPTEDGPGRHRPARFTPRVDSTLIADMDEVARTLKEGSAQIVDARPADRFRGEAPEPRPGVRPGHIPGSRNLPFTEVVKDGTLAAPATIRSALDAAGIDPERPAITSCGSGVSAAILWLALDSIGRTPQALYDGSWAEWGSSDRPIATGPAD
ncbi:3-mercaptopyruvate sulfurtransferase [Ancylobacter terrae]|uniref:3-mercaptopyruvate sulfurtransferase n=1 Tax=Ancylobacter sp. sgz301288 TaxID=3342077 RepID=UPI00385D53A8